MLNLKEVGLVNMNYDFTTLTQTSSSSCFVLPDRKHDHVTEDITKNSVRFSIPLGCLQAGSLFRSTIVQFHVFFKSLSGQEQDSAVSLTIYTKTLQCHLRSTPRLYSVTFGQHQDSTVSLAVKTKALHCHFRSTSRLYSVTCGQLQDCTVSLSVNIKTLKCH